MHDYEKVAFGLFCVVLTYVFVMFTCTVATRFWVFSRDYMEDFDMMHNKETKESRAPDFGFPDCGCGRYAKLLSYIDWYRFNCA